jgi:hypothetical protein
MFDQYINLNYMKNRLKKKDLPEQLRKSDFQKVPG